VLDCSHGCDAYVVILIIPTHSVAGHLLFELFVNSLFVWQFVHRWNKNF
jgi:hypothetical protein